MSSMTQYEAHSVLVDAVKKEISNPYEPEKGLLQMHNYIVQSNSLIVAQLLVNKVIQLGYPELADDLITFTEGELGIEWPKWTQEEIDKVKKDAQSLRNMIKGVISR